MAVSFWIKTFIAALLVFLGWFGNIIGLQFSGITATIFTALGLMLAAWLWAYAYSESDCKENDQ